MPQPYILPLAHPSAVLENVGGKGASLARLVQATLPVPEGFHITTTAYRQFVADNDLQPLIMNSLETVKPASPETWEEAARTIAEGFARAQIPSAITEAIAQAYTALPGSEPAVAVRSSATAEDLPNLSFAGQQESFLNRRGIAAVQEAVQRCWASLWTARAIGYRTQYPIEQGAVALAVVVQQLAEADSAGVLFTANPLNGQRDQMLISATWGLGEALVGGHVTPDTWIVEKVTKRVIQHEVANKQLMTVRTANGTEEQPTPASLRCTPALDDHQVARLTGLGEQIEQLYGIPMDIEWVLAAGQFAIVQARPITALPELMLPTPTNWPLPNPRAMYSRTSLAEHLPNPVSPLFGSLGLRMINQASTEMFRNLMGSNTADIDYGYSTINGYAYLGLILNLESGWALTRMSVAQVGPMFRGSTRRWQQARERLAVVVAEWEAPPLSTLSPTTLLEGVCEVMLASGRFYTVIQSSTLPSSSSSEFLFTHLYNLLKRREEPGATTLLFGFDTAALTAEKSLFDLAEWVHGFPALRDYLLGTSAAQLATALGSEVPPEEVGIEAWAAWLYRVEQHLTAFAHTAYEFDFMNPTPAETPALTFEALKRYLVGQGSNPYERQRAAIKAREQATAALFGRFLWFPKRWFQKLLQWAQETGPAREDSIADMGMGYPAIRRLLGELGARLVKGGALQSTEEIYWLLETEVRELATLLERGTPLPDYRDRIPSRRAAWRAQRGASPPAILPKSSFWTKFAPWTGHSSGLRPLRTGGIWQDESGRCAGRRHHHPCLDTALHIGLRDRDRYRRPPEPQLYRGAGIWHPGRDGSGNRHAPHS